METEEEQVEKLKAWLKENGLSIVFGVVIGVGGIGVVVSVGVGGIGVCVTVDVAVGGSGVGVFVGVGGIGVGVGVSGVGVFVGSGVLVGVGVGVELLLDFLIVNESSTSPLTVMNFALALFGSPSI